MSDEEDDLKIVSFDELEESEHDEIQNDTFGDDDSDDLDSVEWGERLGLDEDEIEQDPWDLN